MQKSIQCPISSQLKQKQSKEFISKTKLCDRNKQIFQQIKTKIQKKNQLKEQNQGRQSKVTLDNKIEENSLPESLVDKLSLQQFPLSMQKQNLSDNIFQNQSSQNLSKQTSSRFSENQCININTQKSVQSSESTTIEKIPSLNKKEKYLEVIQKQDLQKNKVQREEKIIQEEKKNNQSITEQCREELSQLYNDLIQKRVKGIEELFQKVIRLLTQQKENSSKFCSEQHMENIPIYEDKQVQVQIEKEKQIKLKSYSVERQRQFVQSLKIRQSSAKRSPSQNHQNSPKSNSQNMLKVQNNTSQNHKLVRNFSGTGLRASPKIYSNQAPYIKQEHKQIQLNYLQKIQQIQSTKNKENKELSSQNGLNRPDSSKTKVQQNQSQNTQRNIFTRKLQEQNYKVKSFQVFSPREKLFAQSQSKQEQEQEPQKERSNRQIEQLAYSNYNQAQ